MYQAFAFFDGQNLINFQIREFGQPAAGPLNFDLIDCGALTKPEVQARILRGLIAHASLSFIVENYIPGRQSHASADGIAIRTRADEEELQPVIRIAAVIAKQLRSLPVVADKNVQIPVVVKIADSRATADARQYKIGAELIADIFENSSTGVTEHELGFRVACLGMIELDVIEDVAIGHKEIAATVVVVIHKTRPKAAHVKRRVGDF